MDEKQAADGTLSEPEEEGREPSTLIPVVGIGASAGGLEVFKRLLTDWPRDTGFAIVFVQHLDGRLPLSQRVRQLRRKSSPRLSSRALKFSQHPPVVHIQHTPVTAAPW